MIVVIWLGALLFIAGVLYLASHAIWRRRLSGQGVTPAAPAGTLEPERQGMRFLGVGSNWLGILLLVLGAALLLFGGFL